MLSKPWACRLDLAYTSKIPWVLSGHLAVQIAKVLGLDVVDLPNADEVDGAVDLRGGTSAWETFKTVRYGGAFVTVIPEW